MSAPFRSSGASVRFSSSAGSLPALTSFHTRSPSTFLKFRESALFFFFPFFSSFFVLFFFSVNLVNIIVSYATLYRSPEVAYLLTKPVSYSTIFVLKFLDNFLYSSTTLFLVAFMGLVGYGSYFGYPWWGIVGLLGFVLLPFMFLSAFLAGVLFV